MGIIEYPFPDDPAATGYCVFPAELENDGLVFFHATREENREAIMKEGFKIPDPTGVSGLPSVSFARQSMAALTHAMNKRGNSPVAYCILAVRYKTLDRKGIKENPSDIHDYTLDPAPEIIGYCIVPATYRHQ